MSNNIRMIIDRKGLKITFVIGKTGISKSHFYAIMNGEAIPSITNAYKIAEILDVDIDEVFPESRD